MGEAKARQKLITRVRALYAIHDQKVAQWQKENNRSEDEGCITREGCLAAALQPQLNRVGITDKEIWPPDGLRKSTAGS